jgi:endonuclease/exonuclease/phosphatase family metal-dependent hydrolase
MRPVVRVATVNVLNDLSRWQERRSLLAEGLAALSLDVIALQEVTDPLGYCTAHWLARSLEGYELFVCPKSGWGRKCEGIALLSRLPVVRHEILDLQGQQRTAQFVEVRVCGGAVVVANVHLHWPPGLHEARLRQVGRLLAWLESSAPSTAVVVCGDFNAVPGSKAIDVMKERFTSAHEAVHGREPDHTCPTPLVYGGKVRGPITRGLLRLFSNTPGGTWRGTLDYIFVSEGVQVLACDVVLDRPSPDDPGLYASDHFGLAATLALTKPEVVPRSIGSLLGLLSSG